MKSTSFILTTYFKYGLCRHESSFWVDVGVDFGYAAMVTVCLLIVACFLSIAACYICLGHRSRGRVLNLRRANQVMMQSMARPPWTLTLTPDPEFTDHGFTFVGNGVTLSDQNTVVKGRSRTPVTVGAKWSRGVSRGKHVYEVIWPEGKRGVTASVGIGTVTSPLFANGKVTLVGMTSASWGFDIAKRRVFHNQTMVSKCPPDDDDVIPERFLMYLDMDRGELGFGSLTEYWGVVAEDVQFMSQPLYVMVGISACRARVQVFYRGSGSSSAMHHPPPGPIVPRRPVSPISTADSSSRPDDTDSKRGTYKSVMATRARQAGGRTQAWIQETARRTQAGETSFHHHPLSPPPPYSKY